MTKKKKYFVTFVPDEQIHAEGYAGPGTVAGPAPFAVLNPPAKKDFKHVITLVIQILRAELLLVKLVGYSVTTFIPR